jgi:PleD family two-component response regulator
MAECALDFEDQRLAALYEYDVLDTPPEESFDRITRLVKMTLGVPTSVVSLVDRDRQWFKSRQGMEASETPRNISFCTHTIQKDEPLIVPNALDDPRFSNSPLVTCENGVRLYVGVPLKTPSGFNIGALCAIDSKPGNVTPEQIHVLQDLARLVVDELELRKLAAIDSLTGAMTGRSFALEAKKELSRARRFDHSIGCIMFDLDHFKRVNDTYGHAAGDQVLRSVATICSNELRGIDIFGRVGGEEFAIVLPETTMEGATATAGIFR